MTTCGYAVGERMKKRHKSSDRHFPASKMLKEAKDKLWETKEGQNRVVIAGRLRDVLSKK